MNCNPAFALQQELVARENLLAQIRSLAEEDADFALDVVEGQTTLLELISAVDATILEDEFIIAGAKAALDSLQARKRAAEQRIELKRRLLLHALDEAGLKTLRTPTSTLSVRDAGVKAIVVAPEDIPSSYWRAQPPRLDQDALTKAVRAREKALKDAEALSDPDERLRALATVDALHPPIPGVAASNGGFTLSRRV
jgi:hypothetical protein